MLKTYVHMTFLLSQLKPYSFLGILLDSTGGEGHVFTPLHSLVAHSLFL